MIRYDARLCATLGPESSDDKGVRILNRVVTLKDDSIEYEEDQWHTELIVRAPDLVRAKLMSTPGAMERQPEDENEEGVG